MTNFVHLHVHSDFSLLDSTASVMALADRAEELGMEYLALTDDNNMFGVMEFLDACKNTVDEHGNKTLRKNPVKPIIGCEVMNNRTHHLILLASNRQGYLNLVKLCSYGCSVDFIDDKLLAQHHEGLIAFSEECYGEISLLIRKRKMREAEQRALFYQSLFGKGNFYLEIQEHGFQKDLNKAIANVARNTGVPLVATNDVHYLNREDSAAHDILLCIQGGSARTDESRLKYNSDQYYFKNCEEMTCLFSDYPEAIANTVKIAERCVADIPIVEIKDLPKHLPEFKVPQGFENTNAYLRHLTHEGLTKRYAGEKQAGGKPWDDVLKRADYELDIITQLDFANYFLIVADYVNWARRHHIPVGPGRGSAPGSIVIYALHISDIDPIKYGLPFERFLNQEHGSMPDIDIDFGSEGRDEVVKYITEKYSKECVGGIISFGTLWAKAAIRDVALSLGISIPEVEMISKLIPSGPKITLAKALSGEPRLRELEQDLRYTELFAFARKLEGLHRHSSIHPAGLVISKSPLIDSVPLYRDQRTGGTAIQYSMNFLEACGLVKMDLLGLRVLDVIKHTEKLIRRRGGEYRDFCIETIPETDEVTFKMLGEGNSHGVFQFESEGMQKLLKLAKPKSIKDLTALNALYRPGLMEYLPQYIAAKNEDLKIVHPDSLLDELLKKTHGIKTAFNKSHAAAYSLVAYQTAYLKANFPEEFEEFIANIHDT